MGQALIDDAPLTIEALAAHLAEGCKPATEFRIGAEHEKFGFRLGSCEPLPYDGDAGVLALMTGLKQFGWEDVREGETLIGLHRGGANVSLEPGGQFELSGAPLETIHDIHEETIQHLAEVRAVGQDLGIGFLGLGFTPLWTRAEVPVMPKGRYVDLSGRSFRKFISGDLAELPGERATMKDWSDHLTTLFPEVRLKQYIEMRGAACSAAGS